MGVFCRWSCLYPDTCINHKGRDSGTDDQIPSNSMNNTYKNVVLSLASMGLMVLAVEGFFLDMIGWVVFRAASLALQTVSTNLFR